LRRALEEQFLPSNQAKLHRDQLRERRQRPSDTLPELGQYIRRLTNLAYPTTPTEVREIPAKEQFIDALKNSDIRLRVQQARPTYLNDAIRHAVELDVFNMAEMRQIEDQRCFREASVSEDTIAKLLKAVHELQEYVKEIKQGTVNTFLAK
jgi:hypothetical protein